MKKQQRKRIKTYISWVLIVAIVALLRALPMLAGNEAEDSGPQASILNAQAQLRDIEAAVLGGGTLVGETAEAITIPAAVKVTGYLVENGDVVAEGQPIATVDRVSVMAAISQVQETMDYLQEQIQEAAEDSTVSQVAATAGGTVKIIYAQEDERVQDVMLRDGALAALSLDGRMAVQIRRDTDLSGGDLVYVTFDDGTETEGRVESNLEGVLTVTVTDDDYTPGVVVAVTGEDGRRIGSGELYIYSQWNAVAYSGTVSKIRVKAGDAVTSGKILFNLENTGHTARYETLAKQYREYEALMLDLFRMYQSETIDAPQNGMITGVDKNGAYMLADSGAGWKISFLGNGPNGEEESAYIHYLAQVREVGIDGLILNVNPQAMVVTDYRNLRDLSLDPELMTADAIYASDAPVYQWNGESWEQVEMSQIQAGDILLFAGDPNGQFVWVVRIVTQPAEPEGTVPTMPGDAPEMPTEPQNPENPTEGTPDSTEPGTPEGETPGTGFPEGGMPQGGGFGGMGGMVQEDAVEVYALDTVTIASVTGQSTVTVQITVDELDITRIQKAATVAVNALPGEKFDAEVTYISASGENSGGNSKFTVEVTLEKNANMLPGMQASVTIPTGITEQVLSIPVAALVETETETRVYLGYDEAEETFTSTAAVTVGVSDGEYVQILSGIDEGETVYYPYYDTLVISNAPEMSGGRFPFG